MHGAGCEKRERAGVRKNPRLAPLRTGARAKAATLLEATRTAKSLLQREQEHLENLSSLRDLNRLLARAWAISDCLTDREGTPDRAHDQGAETAALLGSVRLIGETLERVSRLEGLCSMSAANLDVLAVGMNKILRRFVPRDQSKEVVIEIGAAVDAAFGSPMVRVTGPYRS